MCGVCMGSFCSRMTHSLFFEHGVELHVQCCVCVLRCSALLSLPWGLGGGFPWGLCWGADCTPWQCCLRAALILGWPRSLGLGCCSLWEVDSVEQTLLERSRGSFYTCLAVRLCWEWFTVWRCIFHLIFNSSIMELPPLSVVHSKK